MGALYRFFFSSNHKNIGSMYFFVFKMFFYSCLVLYCFIALYICVLISQNPLLFMFLFSMFFSVWMLFSCYSFYLNCNHELMDYVLLTVYTSLGVFFCGVWVYLMYFLN